ncbi:penicillin-insensitive murein endopeptidase [Haliangium ochraceum]|uniref:Penicillin-insensitive murein endopeptidase n=1 Tax=Haliangium ochraceum (strain DSM 14365 / JCM 11303 / SMP-2) TaxID=502025 RepID=D0LT36_HALO1|nr:penicillin-insensitive murein endopeptidase [Haliangium ochraceum]ACY19172.1 hypothetical protein Hoch_6708 [Haliangium ochraceum DSM 14365]
MRCDRSLSLSCSLIATLASAALALPARADDGAMEVGHWDQIDGESLAPEPGSEPEPESEFGPEHSVSPSTSCGAANRGSLAESQALARAGIGYKIPEPWWLRGHNYGTAELVGLITRAATTVHLEHAGGVLGVADLSAADGGALPGHRSHQSGRDVDLIYYALSPDGLPLEPDGHMAYYGRAGHGRHARAPQFERDIPERYFDLARNWGLVRAMLEDPHAEVEHIFVSSRVRRWLLDYAQRAEEPEELIAQAAKVLRRPKGVDGHNDHMHVRILCSAEDIALGRCRDRIARRPRRGRRWHSRIACPAPLVSAAEQR